MENRNTPDVKNIWNLKHGFVDAHHQLYMEISPPSKLLHAWKHKVRAAIMSLTTNAFICYRAHFNKDPNKYKQCKLHFMNNIAVHFMQAIILGLCHPTTKSATSSSTTTNKNWQIVYHKLTKGKQKRCAAPDSTTKTGKCGKKTNYYCAKCNNIALCKEPCSLKYHNKSCILIS